jgi:hypothetical protein
MVLVRERTIPTERQPLVGEVSANFWDRGRHVVNLSDRYGLILGFLDRSRYFFHPSSSSIVLKKRSGPRHYYRISRVIYTKGINSLKMNMRGIRLKGMRGKLIVR